MAASLYGTTWQADFVFFDLLALVLPYLVIANLLSGLVAAVRRSWLFMLPVVSLLLWYISLGPFVVFSKGKTEELGDDISILTYNVQELEGNYRMSYTEAAPRILDFVLEQQADIVCFQEFASTRLTREKMKVYPYEYHYGHSGNKTYSPLAVFSKYPILSAGSLDFPDSNNNAIYTDLLILGDTLRVYNIHLQSLRFRPGSLKRENPVRLIRRLGRTIRQQKVQVDLVAQHSANSPYPYILSGDLNNTQYSQVYGRIKKSLNDSYLEKGNGLGTTLLFKFLPFRIDYILVDPSLEITGHQNFDVPYSDHFPVRASFRFER
jgi:endonuclease/exonuclease/phosphatase family metal-dependent hydrolase